MRNRLPRAMPTSRGLEGATCADGPTQELVSSMRVDGKTCCPARTAVQGASHNPMSG